MYMYTYTYRYISPACQGFCFLLFKSKTYFYFIIVQRVMYIIPNVGNIIVSITGIRHVQFTCICIGF